MAWSIFFFENNVLDKVYNVIALRKVELLTLVQNLEELVKKIQDLYNILCDVPIFTKAFQASIQKIEDGLKSSRSLNMLDQVQCITID